MRRRSRAGRGRRTPGALLACLLLAVPAGCIDFVEPDLPELGAPVVLQASVVIHEAGRAELSARLAPGLDTDGFRRTVSDEALRIGDIAVVPDTVLSNGTRVYQAELTIERSPTDPVVIEAPAVDDVAAQPPVVRWFTVRRAGPDTIAVATGDDLVLVLDTTGGTPAPAADVRQWVLGLAGASGTFTIAASGPPPDTIIVPARWIPAPTVGVVRARLIEQQSAQLRPAPGDYVGLLTLDTWIEWTVLVGPSVPAASLPRRED